MRMLKTMLHKLHHHLCVLYLTYDFGYIICILPLKVLIIRYQEILFIISNKSRHFCKVVPQRSVSDRDNPKLQHGDNIYYQRAVCH